MESSYQGVTSSTRRTNGRGGALATRFAQPQSEQQDFQRSLLKAKIANDIKNTIIKDEQQRNEIVSTSIAQERVELQDAVKEVKDAVQEVSQLAISLGGAVIGPECVKDAETKVSKLAFNLGGAFVTTDHQRRGLDPQQKLRQGSVLRHKYHLLRWL